MPGNTLSLTSVYGGSLQPIHNVVAMLAKELDVSKVADFARAIEAAKSIDGKNAERRNYWGELSLWSTRRLGELIRDGQERGKIETHGGNRKSKSHDANLKLSDIDVKPDQSARSQKIAELPEMTIREYVAQAKYSEDEISKAGLIRFATGTEKAGTAAHVSSNTGVPEWYTPDEYLDAARKVLG